MFLLAFAEGGPAVQLLPDGSLLIHIVLILLMIYVLNRTFFRPINNILASRERNRGGSSSEAEEILIQAGKKQADYNSAMLEARNRGYELIEAERIAAVQSREQTLNQARAEVSENVARERAELERQTAEARADIERQAEEMANKISANILNAT